VILKGFLSGFYSCHVIDFYSVLLVKLYDKALEKGIIKRQKYGGYLIPRSIFFYRSQCVLARQIFFPSTTKTLFSGRGPAKLIQFLSSRNMKQFKGRTKVLMSQNLSGLVTVNHFSGPTPN